MTKKDYTAIADVLATRRAAIITANRQGNDDIASQKIAEIDEIAHQLAQVMQQDNPRFEGARFLAACGLC